MLATWFARLGPRRPWCFFRTIMIIVRAGLDTCRSACLLSRDHRKIVFGLIVSNWHESRRTMLSGLTWIWPMNKSGLRSSTKINGHNQCHSGNKRNKNVTITFQDKSKKINRCTYNSSCWGPNDFHLATRCPNSNGKFRNFLNLEKLPHWVTRGNCWTINWISQLSPPEVQLSFRQQQTQ